MDGFYRFCLGYAQVDLTYFVFQLMLLTYKWQSTTKSKKVRLMN